MGKMRVFFEFTCMSTRVTLQIEGVVESLAAKGAQVTLGVGVTLHVTIQQPLKAEHLAAKATLKLGRVDVGPRNGHLVVAIDDFGCQRIFDAEAPVDHFNGRVWR